MEGEPRKGLEPRTGREVYREAEKTWGKREVS